MKAATFIKRSGITSELTGRGDYLQPSTQTIKLKNALPALRSNDLLYADLSPIGIQTHKSDTDDKHKEPADKKIDRQPAGG